MRSLLFYQEVKARHANKIKSKEYHRKLSKAAKRKAAAAGADGDDMDEDAVRTAQEQAEFERAKVGGAAGLDVL
jgi:U3 small nucleolar RNA-associated protein 14